MKNFVVLFDENQPLANAYHYCTADEYKAAKEQNKNYSHEVLKDFNTAAECEEFINDDRAEKSEETAAVNYSSMTKAQIVEALKDQFNIEAGPGLKKDELLKLITEAANNQ